MAGRGERSWDIGNWLRGLGLEQYEAGFRQNEVNESVLPKLTQEAATEAAAKAIGLEAEILEVRSRMISRAPLRQRKPGTPMPAFCCPHHLCMVK